MAKILALLAAVMLAGCSTGFTPDGEVQKLGRRGKDAYYKDYYTSHQR